MVERLVMLEMPDSWADGFDQLPDGRWLLTEIERNCDIHNCGTIKISGAFNFIANPPETEPDPDKDIREAIDEIGR